MGFLDKAKAAKYKAKQKAGAAKDKVKAAGDQILDYLDEKGYLTIQLEQLHNKDKHDFGIEGIPEDELDEAYLADMTRIFFEGILPRT